MVIRQSLFALLLVKQEPPIIFFVKLEESLLLGKTCSKKRVFEKSALTL